LNNHRHAFASYIPNQSGNNFKNKEPIALFDDAFQNIIGYQLENLLTKMGLHGICT